MNHGFSNRGAWTPSDASDKELVSLALEEILASALFRSSRRYPVMLRYIVEKTLANQHSDLKERTIGVEVFGRSPAYDTSTDPVVRFTAGEIRKRLAQFYQQNGTGGPVMLELPSGTYVPRFHLRAHESAEREQAAAHPHPESSAIAAIPVPPPTRSSRTVWPYYLIAALILVAIGAGFFIHSSMRRNNPVMEVWAPLLRNPNTVLISVGGPLQNADEPQETPDISLANHILQPGFRISITALDAIANIVGFLKTAKKPFRIRDSSANTLAALRERPVVLVAGNDNQWTLLLLKSLRFHLVQQGSVSYIEDTQNPGFHGWSVDFSKPFREQTADYAIVARFYSPITNGPVIAVAGISSDGTQAAGEFIVSPQDLVRLEKSLPSGDLQRNFEVVLKVKVVDGNAGATTVLASQFW